MTEWILGLTCACALLALGLALLALRDQRRRYDELAERLSELAMAHGSATQVAADRVESAGPSPSAAHDRDYVITALAETDAHAVARAQPGSARPTTQFVPHEVVRESAILGAAWLHGLRRALDPATRNRITFEMRRELKRSRKARKQEIKQALREFRARERGNLGGEEAA